MKKIINLILFIAILSTPWLHAQDDVLNPYEGNATSDPSENLITESYQIPSYNLYLQDWNNEGPIVDKTYLAYHPIDFESIKNELIDNIMEMEFTFIDLEWAEVRSKGFQKDMFGCLCNLESASIKDDLDVLSVIDENQEMTNNLIVELKNCLDKLMIYNKNLELLKNAK